MERARNLHQIILDHLRRCYDVCVSKAAKSDLVGDPKNEDLISIYQAAEVAGCHWSTIRRWWEQGTIRRYKMKMGRWRYKYSRSELMTLKEALERDVQAFS
jgi:excisionase family DNA binding protein